MLWPLTVEARESTAPSGKLTAQEIKQLTWWAIAYHAEAAYGAEDGKKWAFARYLCMTRRINEDEPSGERRR